MSASRTKKERQAAALSGLSQKEKQAQAAAKAKKRNTIIYTVIGIVVAICVAALLFWDSGVIQRHSTAVTIGSKEYGVVDLDYYYYTGYSSYSSYASLYGLDSSKPLDEQEVYEGYTWDQMLKDTAVSALNNVSMLAQEAEAAGFELSEEGKTTIQNTITNTASYATLYGVSQEYFLRSNYGKYMTVKDFERIITEAQLAQEYSESKRASFDVSDEEIQDYYAEHTADLDTIDYNCYLVSFDRTEKDAEGNSVDLDENTIETNRAEAEARAQEILDALVDGDQEKAAELAETYGAVDDSNMSGISYSGFADWMADDSHKAGSYGLVENISASSENVIGYFAIYVNDRYLDDYTGADIRVIRIAATKDEDDNYNMDALASDLDTVLESYESGEKTAEAFGTLANNYSADASAYTDGIRENVSKTAYNDEITDWIFSNSRKEGDYKAFTDEENHNAYLIYFTGRQDTAYWRTVCTSNVRTQKFNDWQTETAENYAAANGFGMRFVG